MTSSTPSAGVSCETALYASVRTQWLEEARSPGGLWIFGYGSLIWKPELAFVERRAARVFGWHRALAMWSRVNRGTPERPGLVFAMLSGGSCRGVVYRLQPDNPLRAFATLWAREMPYEAYSPRWLTCRTPAGDVRALAFTLSRRSPVYTGALPPERYRDIFLHASGRYGTTLAYAQQTWDGLCSQGIHDRELAQLLRYAPSAAAAQMPPLPKGSPT